MIFNPVRNRILDFLSLKPGNKKFDIFKNLCYNIFRLKGKCEFFHIVRERLSDNGKNFFYFFLKTY